MKDTVSKPSGLNSSEDHEQTLSARIMQEIESEIELWGRLDGLADRLHYHPTYIRRVFHKETGLTLQAYSTQVRIRLAQRWLLESDRKIQEISEQLVYTNSQNFIRVFRKATGMTPGQYREQSQKGDIH